MLDADVNGKWSNAIVWMNWGTGGESNVWVKAQPLLQNVTGAFLQTAAF